MVVFMSFEAIPTSISERVLGISNGQKPYESFKSAYELVMQTGEIDYVTFNNIMDRLEMFEMFRGGLPGTLMDDVDANEAQSKTYTAEAALVARSIADVVSDGYIEYSNSLVDWPTYQKLMRQHGKKIGGVALMIGAISPLSVKAFDAIADDEYGADHAVVVDIEGSSAKYRQGNFLFASGLELPFADESISYVHTNRLLHMLEDPHWKDRDSNVKTREELLFEEIFRVLKPGGQLLMQETRPRILMDVVGGLGMFKDQITELIEMHNFADIYTGQSDYILNHQYLFDRSRDFSKYLVTLHENSVDAFARKPC